MELTKKNGSEFYDSNGCSDISAVYFQSKRVLKYGTIGIIEAIPQIIACDCFCNGLGDCGIRDVTYFEYLRLAITQISKWQKSWLMPMAVSISYLLRPWQLDAALVVAENLCSKLELSTQKVEFAFRLSTSSMYEVDYRYLLGQVKNAGFHVLIDCEIMNRFGVELEKDCINTIEVTVAGRKKNPDDSLCDFRPGLIEDCKMVGINTVAIGVRTRDEYDQILKTGFCMGQGSFFDEPTDPATLMQHELWRHKVMSGGYFILNGKLTPKNSLYFREFNVN